MPTTEADGTGGGAVLTSARLRLRPIRRTDMPRVVELAGVPEVALNTSTIPFPYALDQGYAWFDRMVEDDTPPPFVVEPRGGALVGMVGLIVRGTDSPLEIGYWLGRPFWGQGYMTEAVEAAVAFGFARFAASRMVGRVFLGNDASCRVLQRCSFVRCGRATISAPARGGERVVDLFERIAPDGAAHG